MLGDLGLLLKVSVNPSTLLVLPAGTDVLSHPISPPEMLWGNVCVWDHLCPMPPSTMGEEAGWEGSGVFSGHQLPYSAPLGLLARVSLLHLMFWQNGLPLGPVPRTPGNQVVIGEAEASL